MRVYRGIAGDDRLADRRTQLLSAGLELLAADDAPQGFTVRGVCRRAGLASRYFYENFEDTGDLAVAVYDEEILAMTSRTFAALEGVSRGDVEGRARASLGALVGQIAEDPRRGRLLYSPALEALPAIAARRRASTRLFVGLLVDESHSGTPVGGPSDVISEMLVGGLAQAISAWLDDDVPLAQEDFVEACSQVFAHMLSPGVSR